MSLRARSVLLATSMVFVVGFVVASATPAPLLTADDLAYLSMARALAGDGASPIPPQPPYGVLYPVLLAPGWVVGLGGDGMIVWARLVNAAAGALLVPVLVSLLRRFVDGVSHRAQLGAAVAGAMLPAGLLTASIVWSERLLMLLVAAAALATVTVVQRGAVRDAAGAVVAAVAMTAAHPRLGVASVIVILVAVAAVRDRGLAARVSLGAAGAVGIGVVEWLRDAVARVAFGASGTYDAADLASRRGPGEVVQMLQHGLGALTYVVLATTGIAAWGVVVLARRRWSGWAVLAIGGGVLLVAAWFLTGIPRADKWLHGRYIEVIGPVLVAVGLASLLSLRGRVAGAVLVGLPAVAGVIAAWNGPGDTWAAPRSPVMMLGVEVSGAPYGGSFFEPGAAASVAVVVGGLAWLVARRWGIGRAALVVVLASLWGAHSGLETLDRLYDGTPSAAVEELVPADEAIGEVYLDTQRVSPNLTGALAWHVGFDRATLTQGPETTHVLLAVDDPAPDGAVAVAEFPGVTLWRLVPHGS